MGEYRIVERVKMGDLGVGPITVYDVERLECVQRGSIWRRINVNEWVPLITEMSFPAAQRALHAYRRMEAGPRVVFTTQEANRGE